MKTIIVTQEKNKNQKSKELEEKYKIKFIFMNNLSENYTNKSNGFSMKDIIMKIGELGIDSILIEGGNKVISKAFEENIIDAGEIFVSNKILGDETGIPFMSGFKKIKMHIAIIYMLFSIFLL